MKFKFTYEKILAHRKTARDIAARDYSEIRHLFDKANNELNEMYKSIEEAWFIAGKLKAAGGYNIDQLNSIDSFIKGQTVKTDIKKIELRNLKMTLEQKQEVLNKAAQEHKIFEKLKEKMKEKFKKQLQRHELKMTDELVVMRAGRAHGNRE